MKIKRLLSLLLTLCCLLTLLPAGFLTAQAAEPEGEVISGTIPFQVNPLYADIIDTSAFEHEVAPAPPKTYGTSNYVSFSKGAAMMRDTMVDRGAYLNINYTTSSDVRQSLHDLTDAAFTHTGNPKEGDYLRYTYGGWSCSYSYYSDSNGMYYVSASFDIAYYTTASQEAELDRAVDSLLDQLDLYDNSDYQKLYGIYDYIATNVRYDYDHLYDDSYLLQYTAYAALVNKTAVCQGYANLFYRLALELGVDARIVSGIGNGGPHAWNIAKLDGKYYNLDSTWDEGCPYYSWFLLSNSSFTNHSREDRFLTAAFDNAYPMSATDYVYDSVKSNIQIDTQPKSVTVASGKTAKVTVKARGEGLKYQWYIKDPGSSSYSKSSITGSSYSVTMNSDRNGRYAYCIITDAYGNKLKTNTVALKMESHVAIVTQPKSVTVAKGATAKVTVKATGDGLTYRWYYKDTDSSSFTYTSSFTGNTYSVTMNEVRNGRQVLCRVYDKYGNVVQTNTVKLSMANTVKITQQPKSITVVKGETAKVTVKATGDGLTYRWYFKDTGDSSYTYTSSYTGNTYSVTMNDARNGRQVLCRVYDKYGNVVQTNAVKLSMANTVKITQQPKSITVAKGETAKVTVKATGDGLTYRWYYKNPGDSGYTYTSSYAGNTYSVTMNDARDGRQVLCRVYDKYGNVVQTNTVTLKMS